MSEASRSYALSVRGLSVSYGRAQLAVDGLSFGVEAGRLVGVIGPNGAGKSTMIKGVVGALEPSAGEVLVFGQPASKALGRMTYVPQRGAVDWDFPVTVWDVVAQGCYGRLGLLKRMSAKERAIVDDALEKVGMSALRARQIGELSGGQQQRVFLARALAQQGDVYLLDEPFVGVDARTELAIVEVLKQLKQQGKTVLVVHHDLSTAREYFDEVLLMNKRLIAYGPVAQCLTPELLREAYGGRLTILGDASSGQALLVEG